MTSLSQHQELVFPIYQMICMVPRLIVNFGIVSKELNPRAVSFLVFTLSH